MNLDGRKQQQRKKYIPGTMEGGRQHMSPAAGMEK